MQTVLYHQRVSLAMSLLDSQGVAGERRGQANCKEILESLPIVLDIHQADKQDSGRLEFQPNNFVYKEKGYLSSWDGRTELFASGAAELYKLQ